MNRRAQDIKVITLCFFIMNYFLLQAQNNLTLQDAIGTTLKNNYGIQIVQYEKQITDLQNHPGYAGMLPTVSATAIYQTELSNTEQRYFSGETRSEQNAGATLIDAGVYLNYTVFDGLRMFATKERLEELAAMGELEVRRQMEETIFLLMSNWYQLIQLQNGLQVIGDAIDISAERFSIATARQNAGAASGLDVIQAQVDLNADSSLYINILLQIENLKININQLMSSDPATSFETNDTIVVEDDLLLEVILSESSLMNTDILLAQKDQQIVDLQVKEFKSYMYPTLDLTGGYGYLRSTSEAGFVESNLSYGPSVLFTLNIPLFNAFTTSRNLEGSQITQQIKQTQIRQTELTVRSSISTVYNQYRTSLDLIKLENRNIEAARKTVDIALEKFNLGSLTSVELREIQQTQIDAENRLLIEQLNAKLAELQLKKLSGRLL
ncbi:MAG: TolC family protein [Chitinophagales bacterium]|nr:TolC family protein [Chitinophagales bacterium]